MSRSRGALAVLAVLFLGLIAQGCGGDDGATQEQLDAAREAGAKEAKEQARIDQLENRVKQLQEKATDGADKKPESNAGRGDGYYEEGTASGGPVASCQDGVRVGPNTTCSFAMNVAGEYGSNPGATTISAYSPATGRQYTLSCGSWSGGGTVCMGGNGATVYLP